MQILIEAARQLAVLAVEQSTDTEFSTWTMTHVVGQFHRFAELDQVTSVYTPRPAIDRGQMKMRVLVTQAEQDIALVDMSFSRDKSMSR